MRRSRMAAIFGARSGQVAGALALVVASVGALIVLGWAFDTTLIPSGVARAPRVRTNTGVCFVLAGVGLWLAVRDRVVWFERLFAVVVVVIGGLSLLESALTVDFGIDQLLFRDPAGLDPGRMPPNTALAFILCGVALLLLRRRRRGLLAEALGLVAAVIGWLAVIGFAAGLSQLVQVGPFVKMSLPSAICFLLLGGALVLATADGRLVAMLGSRGAAGPLVRRLLAVVIVVGPVGSIALNLGRSTGLLDQGAVVLLIVAVVALSLLGVALWFANSLDLADMLRVSAEQELRDSERHHREIIEASLDAFIAMDRDGVITAWNPAAETLFGWSVEEAIGRTVAEMIVPERLRARHQEGLERVAAGGETSVIGQRLELSAVRRDGREVLVELSVSISEGSGGRCFHGFVHDINEREHTRRLLAHERRLLDSAQAIAQLGSWSWDPAADRAEWSAETYRIFDRDPAHGALAGEEFFAYIHPDDRERIMAGYAEAFGAGEGFELDYRIVVGDGEVRFLHGLARREGNLYVGSIQDVTVLRRAQDALVQSEQANRTLAMIVAQSEDAIIAKRLPDGVITQWNRGAERIYGYPASEIVGQPISVIVPPERSGEEREIVRQMLAGQSVGQFETRRQRKDGSVIDVSLTISPIHDADGRIVAASIISRDITERKRREQNLRRSEASLAEAQRLAHIGSWAWEPATDSTEWSAEMYRIFDRDPCHGPAASEGFFAYLHPEDRDRIVAGYVQAFGAGEAFELDYRIVLGEHDVRFVHAIGQREGDGRYVGTVQDVTALRHAEHALRETDARLRAIFDYLPAGLSLRGLDGRYLQVNDYVASALGTSPVELLGSDPAEHLDEATRERVRAEDEQMRVAREPVSDEIRLANADGTDRDYYVVRYPVLDQGGEVSAFGSFTLDITERKRIESALREAEERFRSAFEDAPIGMALADLDGRFVQVNEAFCAMTGYEHEQLEGTSFESITHPDDVERDHERLRTLRTGERSSYNTEKRYVHASGHPIHVAVHATLLHTADGIPLNFLGQMQDITDRKRHEEQLEWLADHDALTGLLNRRAFKRELASHAALIARYGAAGTVLMVDLDQFKFVNDTLGHQAGDDLIVRVARLLAERLRATDVLARLGGDEFAVLLPKAGPEAAQLVAHSVLETLRAEAIPIAGTECKITASIGIASFEDASGLSAEDVLINADLAMYDAKEAGRDQIATFSTDQYEQARMKGRITWAKRITSALETDGFTLLAQPIIDLATGRASQYELLLRMRDEHGDLIPPSSFLYIAERLDLIQEIDAWVVSHGIQALSQLDDHHDIALEINLSGRSLGDQKLLEHIDSELRNAHVAPERIIFEITETAALTSVTKARAFGEHLSEIGCRFALDDFGAGFGSFYYLKHLVFDYLKIDGEFIRDCRSNDTDKLVIQAIVDIARGMGKRTIAEFVGDDETVRLLTRLGVDYGQGYHLGMPAPLQPQLTAVSTPQPSTPRSRPADKLG